MKIEKTTILIFVAVTFTFGLLTNANANLIANGSFENGVAPGVTLPVGSTAITGWKVTRDRIDYIGTYWEASDGNNSLDLDNSPGYGGIEQTFATTPGQNYLVTFDMAGNPYTGKDDPFIKYMGVSAATQSGVFQFDTEGRDFGDMGWETHSWPFTANAISTTLEFYSLDAVYGEYSGWCGPALDNVSVVIPEPATIALLGLGGLLLRRKRSV